MDGTKTREGTEQQDEESEVTYRDDEEYTGKWSVQGSVLYCIYNVMSWNSWMHAGVSQSVSLPMVLTGADSIPPLGLDHASLNFNESNAYPTASTCALELTLPTKHWTYDEFMQHFDVAFTMHGGFGLK